MKKVTKKAINKALPRVDVLRKAYILHGFTGILRRYAQTFDSAYADVDEDGDVDITFYAVGDARERHHYYGYDTTYIGDIIEEWYRGNLDRKEAVDAIQEAMMKTLNEEENYEEEEEYENW